MTEMLVKKSGGKIFGAHLTAAEQKAMNMEIQRQCAEFDKKNAREIDAMVLWVLHEVFGFGPDRLHKFYKSFNGQVEALAERYQMTDDGDQVWLCLHKLKEYGINLEEWEREAQTQRATMIRQPGRHCPRLNEKRGRPRS